MDLVVQGGSGLFCIKNYSSCTLYGQRAEPAPYTFRGPPELRMLRPSGYLCGDGGFVIMEIEIYDLLQQKLFL